jgi:hypothetical protein
MYSGNNGNQFDMSRSGGMLMVSRGQLQLLTTYFVTYPAYMLHLALQIYFSHNYLDHIPSSNTNP